MDKANKESTVGSRDDEKRVDLILLKDRALDIAAEGITISDMSLPDQPLIYINEGFERLTGYSAKSMIGKNCRFLQGDGTDPETVQEIREALAAGRECTVEILNYNKDNVPFWNRLSLTPVVSPDGEVTHFIGVQSDITKRKNAEEALREANQQLGIANRHMKGNLEAAARIQRSLLPEPVQEFDGIRFASAVQPCDELGGDTLSIVPISEGRFAVYMVDVSGHGVPASLLSVSLSHWFSRVFGRTAETGFHFSPVEIAEALNTQFKMSQESAQYFTMCFGILDMNANQFRYVSAGSPPLIVVRENQRSEIFMVEGFPVGLIEEATYSESTIDLAPGDRIFVYTDGVTEAEDPDQNLFGTERLAKDLLDSANLPLDASVSSVPESVTAWSGVRNIQDDVSILGIEVTKPRS